MSHFFGATVIEIQGEEEEKIINETEKPIEIESLDAIKISSTKDCHFSDSDQETIVPKPTVSTRPDIKSLFLPQEDLTLKI